MVCTFFEFWWGDIFLLIDYSTILSLGSEFFPFLIMIDFIVIFIRDILWFWCYEWEGKNANFEIFLNFITFTIFELIKNEFKNLIY
jgi:hypothetical protein